MKTKKNRTQHEKYQPNNFHRVATVYAHARAMRLAGCFAVATRKNLEQQAYDNAYATALTRLINGALSAGWTAEEIDQAAGTGLVYASHYALAA